MQCADRSRVTFGLALVLGTACPVGAIAAADRISGDFITRAERTGFRETSPYEETVTYCRALAEASPWIDLQSIGTSPEGRDIALLVLSREGFFTPEAARESGRTVVLVTNCIHAGECAGKDASLMLVRDIAIGHQRAALVERVILLVVPIFNVDGMARFGQHHRVNQNGPAEMGWRSTAQRLNLNRDWLKADTREMRALLAVWNAWNPHLHIDTHTTDGADHQYDLLFAAARRQEAAPAVAQWVDQMLYPALRRGLAEDGHLATEYGGLVDRQDVAKGMRIWPQGPRYSTGYGAIRNRPSILVEAHALKPYRTRVLATYSIIRHAMEELNRRPAALPDAVEQADAETAAFGRTYDPDVRYPLALELTDEHEPFTFKGREYRRELSEVSGGLRVVYGEGPVDIPSRLYAKLRVTAAVAPPLAYLIPPEWSHVTELLRVHGLRYEHLDRAVRGEFESYRFSGEEWSQRPQEGHHQVSFTTELITERRTYPAGSVLVRLNQPAAKVAVHLFEPESPDSLVAGGFFDQIFAQIEYGESYVLEALAREMLARDPELRSEFEERLRSDPQFAASPRARLYFFYRRSPYWDDHKNKYPVARVTGPLP
ncbi:MAG: M14 family metallopeptidase [Phycisphaerales bacterium]|nr:MAG: M14 family metallopeptidase [Phycisphaerales bacterium]